MKPPKDLTISPEASVKEGLRQIDRGGEKIAFVTNSDGILLGTVSDGDIRRYILKNGNLSDNIKLCYNSRPMVLGEGYSNEQARRIMLANRTEVVPIVTANGKFLGYVTWDTVFGQASEKARTLSTPVVIMAGGKGTRLAPFTNILPKPLIPVGDKPIVETIMDKFHEFGCEEFYLTVNYKGEMIKSYFDNTSTPYNLHYLWEKEFCGTAGSLSLLPRDVGDTIMVSNCDIIVEADYADLVELHRKNGYDLTIVGSIQHYRIPYGILEYEEGGALCSITEKPEYDFVVNTGLYVLERRAIDMIPEGKFYNMTDLIAELMKKKNGVGVYPVSEKSYVDIGQWEEYRKNVEKFLADRDK